MAGGREAVRVLVVDDSAFMRNALGRMLSSDPAIAVIGTARDGAEAVEKVRALRPDVVTMDVEMPVMDGLAALRRIMAESPVPVIMVSSLTVEGARVTLDALDLGAVDFVPKNLGEASVNVLKIRDALVEKVKAAGTCKAAALAALRAATPRGAVPPLAHRTGSGVRRAIRQAAVVVVGASTGGPRALQEVVGSLPPDLPVPVLVIQHMPAAFTGPFAERLAQVSKIRVKEAEEKEVLRPATVFVAPGRGHLSLVRVGGGHAAVAVSRDRADLIYRPSVDLAMCSVAEHYPGRALGVILTGMGNDGCRGMERIRSTGGRTIAQDERTCVVYGMPRAVVEAGLADKVLPLHEIAQEIVDSV